LVICKDLEIDGYKLPEKESIGVLKDLQEDMIIGLNIIEACDIIFEKEKVGFRRYPPTSFIY
jgi:hypothetical protein